TIWNRAPSLTWQYDKNVKHTHGKRDNGISYHEITTPIGTVYEEFAPTESQCSAPAHIKHFITDLDSLKIMTYIAEASRPAVDFTGTQKALDETGEDGIVLNSIVCVPFIQFAKTDAGYMNAFYLLEDHPDVTNALIAAYHKNYVTACKLMRSSPADVIAFNDNMDELMMPPNLFERYAMGFYQECTEALKGSGKITQAHWCGRTQHLLPLVPQTGLDVVEAVVTQPMADITLEAALDKLEGKVTLQGGIPSVLVCPEGASPREIETYIEKVILPQKGRKGFILGMSDNVPPNAEFARVELVAGFVN
ncbi:MAG: uroporphyrinogen decarboxylase family protein, partial [Clostridia bacterium]|nr:uroporphyrinogen decarboxylase family protein [Clostridia bacterium]